MSLIIWSVFTLTIVYLYFGFPFLLSLGAKFFKKDHLVDENYEPTVTLVISAYNEEEIIQKKLQNSLELDYPAGKLEIVVVSDCSSDKTDEIVQDFSSAQVKLIRMAERTGKTAGLNRALEQIDSDMVVFSDANAIYDSQAIRKLVRHFVDENIGYVVGHARYAKNSDSASGESEDLYWNYEIKIKQWESDFCSVVGGDGALYMIRRELYQPLETTDINDFVNPLQIIAAGYRGLFEPEAFCVEHASESFEKEFGRKVRIVNRSFNGLLRVSELLNPFKYSRFAWLIISHKMLRWFSPYILLVHFSVTLFLPIYGSFALIAKSFLSIYLVGFLCAFIGWFFDRRGLKSFAPFYLAHYFMLMNIASAYGVFRRLRGDQIVTWSTVRNDKTSHTIGSNAAFISTGIGLAATGLRLSSQSYPLNITFPLEWSVYSLFFLLIYVYIGYPFVLLMGRPFFRRTHFLDENYTPEVTLLIAAYNEESVIADKLQNSLKLDYPTEKLQILLVSDGSTDETESIAKVFLSKGIKLLALPSNQGKVSALNEAFKQINTEIVVMSDANVMYQPDVLRKLVRHFADSTVGGVSGKVVLLNEEVSYSEAENKYYNIEHLVQLLEGESGAMIGSDGAMYALRRELYAWPKNDTILDDFVISMSIIRQGKLLIHDPEALGYEINDQELVFELRRKVRIVAGGIQCLLRTNVYPPCNQIFTWFKFISHKVLRWFSGFILLLLVIMLFFIYITADFHPWPVNGVAIITVSMIFVGIVGWAIPKSRNIKLVGFVYYFLVMHVASLLGVYKGLVGSQKVTWKRSET